ncbi:MAG TPA: hypothetical protein DEV93_03485 [Chloroflexi bacterium]|nr:hypothetical protein [Chloroflexota bacterium]
MTAPDPRLGEIEGRLSKAEAGPWFLDSDGVSIYYVFHNGDTLDRDKLAESSGADAEFIANAPTDVAYLLTELRKRDDALAAIEKLLDEKYKLWAAICGNTCSKDILGVDHDAIADEIAAAIRAAVTAAMGDGE